MKINSLDVVRYLDDYGIKHAYKGYRYLVSAIELGIENPEKLMSIMELYQDIAKVHHTRPENVEHSIRYAVASLRMTNKEVISMMVDDFLCNYRSKNRFMRMKRQKKTGRM